MTARRNAQAPLRAILALAMTIGLTASGWALNPVSSPSFEVVRTSTNNGSAVQTSGGGAYQVLPHIVGGPVAGASSSASFSANQGRVGAISNPQDDVFVDPAWANQTDVDNDPTVGVAGCNSPTYPLTFGVNAFASIPPAIGAVNPLGRVHLMNSTFQEENIAVAKAVSILGHDESVPGCSGLDGRNGAIVTPATAAALDKAVFDVQSSTVVIKDMTIDGNNAAVDPSTDADYGVLLADASGTWNNLLVQNADVRNFRRCGVSIVAPGTVDHVVRNVAFESIGDYAAGFADGSAVRIGGADTTVEGGSVTMATSGVAAYGNGPGSLPSVAGTATIPDVTVDGVDFLSIGGGGASGEGAVAFLHTVTGTISNNQIEGADRGVQVAFMSDEGTATVDGNAFVGPLNTAVDVYEIYTSNIAVNPAEVVVSNNTFEAPIEMAAIGVRQIGRDTTVSRNLGHVFVDGNTITDLSGLGSDPEGIIVHAVDPTHGSVDITNNGVDGLSSLLTNYGVSVTTTDPIAGSATAFDTVNVAIDGNTITDWSNGIRVSNSAAPGAAVAAANVGQNTPNTIADCNTGLRLGLDTTVDAGNSLLLTPQEIRDSAYGVFVSDVSSQANLVNNAITGNGIAALAVSAGGRAMLEDNFIQVAGDAGAVGVTSLAGGGTVDMGGGAFGSTGGNTFDVLASNNNWAVSFPEAGTYQGENNTWSYAGTAYNAPVAIDDLIRDSDADNMASGTEGSSAALFDFIPFAVGTRAASVTVDDTAVRGVTSGYGSTVFRTFSDGLEGVADSGTVTVEDGYYEPIAYNANSEYIDTDVAVTRPVTVTAANPGGAVVLPPADAPGTAVAAIEEAGTQTILAIESDDVELDGLVFDGENPALAGGLPLNGRNVMARNGVVIRASAGDGPDRVRLANLEVRNIAFKGIAVVPSAGNAVEDLEVADNTFDNIDAFQLANNASAAFDAEGLQRLAVVGNTVSRVRAGLRINADDDASTHLIARNTIGSASWKTIEAGGVRDLAVLEIANNTLTPVTTGVEISDVTTSGMVLARGNQITSGTLALGVLGVDAESLVWIDSNTFKGASTGAGVATYDTATTGTGFGVLVSTNTFDSYTTAVQVADYYSSLSALPNTGTTISANLFTSSTVAASIQGTTSTVYALVGGLSPSGANRVTTTTVAFRVGGPAGTADVAFNKPPDAPPYTRTTIDGVDLGVLVTDGAQARVTDNQFDNAAVAAMRVTGSGTGALLERNTARGTTNAVGISIQDGAIVSMGPGTASEPSGAFYAGTTTSVGLNKLRDYTGTGNHFAIWNESVLDQNAQNNDFATVVLAEIETVVEHQPDNGLGLVLFDPPSSQFTGVDDWSALQAD